MCGCSDMLGQTAHVCPPLLIALQKRPKLSLELCDDGKHGEARRRRPPVERQNKHLDLLMGRSCGTSSQRSCHGSDALAIGTPGLFNAPVFLSPIRIVVLFSGKVRMSVLDQQVGRHKPPFCSIPLTLVDFATKLTPSSLTRYLCVSAGGCVLAAITMGRYSVLLLVPAVVFPLLVRWLDHSTVLHVWTFGLQMLWQTSWHLRLQYQEYYLQEPVCIRYHTVHVCRSSARVIEMHV